MTEAETGDRAARTAAFMADLARLAEAQPALFEAGDASIWPAQHKGSVLDENQGDIEIAALAADEPGCGWGGTILKLVTALADRHGVDVFVKALADDEEEHPESISQGDLEFFYAKAGFLDIGSWSQRDMIRRPATDEETLRAGEALLASAFAGEALWPRKRPPAP